MTTLNAVPTITITLSTPQQKLLEQESEYIPPEYTPNTQHEEREVSTMATTNDENRNDSSLTYPVQAHIPPSSTPTDLPTYDYATTVDMPPEYPSPKTISEGYYYNNNIPLEDPWPITKKLYFLGFLFWPLWFIGMGFSMFGRADKTRLWGRRCAWNSLVIIVLFIYLVVAYTRTGGRLI